VKAAWTDELSASFEQTRDADAVQFGFVFSWLPSFFFAKTHTALFCNSGNSPPLLLGRPLNPHEHVFHHSTEARVFLFLLFIPISL
jgi:hypothetical protein